MESCWSSITLVPISAAICVCVTACSSGSSPGADADAGQGAEVGADATDSTDSGDGGTCIIANANTTVPPHGGAACPGGGSGTCSPQDETTFNPTWVPPSQQLHACTSAQIGDYYSNCLNPATVSVPGCNAWVSDNANAGCLSCLLTDSTSAQYGVLIAFPGNQAALNVAGCIALAEPCNIPCAKALLADIECKSAACNVTTNCASNPNANTACETAAESCTACSGYFNQTGCLQDLRGAQHPAQQNCGTGTASLPFGTTYTAIATFMCGQ